MPTEIREYHFEPLNESATSTNENQGNNNRNQSPSAADQTDGQAGQFHSRLNCCGVNLFDLSFSPGQCQFSTSNCFVQLRGGTDGNNSGSAPQRSKFSGKYIFITTMVHCLVFAIIGFLVLQQRSKVSADSNKYRVCVVDGRGGFKRAEKYCPILDGVDSKVECVIGLDRMDCLRRIGKGKVDFSVFTSEDLIAATNSQIEVLITNELRYLPQKYEYSVVAVVSDASGINSKYDVQGKKFCHPGYGYEVDWTNILANYFESTVVPKSCVESLTLVENRIKASSEYFRAACKAGPWVLDDILDQELKKKYPNLCALCGTPGRCSKMDKYWGRRGPLYCLTDGVGDIAWVRLDDAILHFGIEPGAAAATPEGYSYLCPDGTKRPVNTTTPCVWVSKPWPVIAAKRTSAQEIQGFINRLDHSDTKSWQHALLNLIESYHVEIESVNPIQAIESYLINTPGFQSANSFTGCHPPRSIRMCTTSNLENAKCGWMRESVAVYGIEPDFECIKANNKTHCLEAVQKGFADAVLISPDLLMTAQRDYNLKTLLYEDVKPEDRYETVAVVRKSSSIRKFEDLKGKKACFPSFEGIAWNSMLYEFHQRKLLSYECPFSIKAAKYFGDTCAPGAPNSTPESLKKLCKSPSYEGEFGALKCFTLENADVAFVSKTSLKKLWDGHMSSEKWVSKLESDGTRIVCQEDLKPCELSWSTIGEIMVRPSLSDMALHEAQDVFIKTDELFGNDYKALTRSFSMYGPFDGVHDVLFHDDAIKLRSEQYLMRIEKSIPSYDVILKDVSICMTSNAHTVKNNIILLCLSAFPLVFSKFML